MATTLDRTRKRVLILGGGFGGVYAALELQKYARHHADVDVTLVARENFFLFTPMLPQAATSSVDVGHIVVNLRRIIPKVRVLEAEIRSVDLAAHTVTIVHEDVKERVLAWDYLLLAVGGENNFFGLPGVAEHALTIRTLSDAIAVRDSAIDMLERAELEDDPTVRRRLLTFVIAGAGFAGIETAAELDLYVRTAAKSYRNVRPDEVSTYVVELRTRILPELSQQLATWTQTTLEKRGVKFKLGTAVKAADADGVVFADGSRIDTQVFIWTGGVGANPLVAALPGAERGRLPVDTHLVVRGYSNVWAVGDCAIVTPPDGGPPYPPTAQHALREGIAAGRNMVAVLAGKPQRPFAYTAVGQMAHLGKHQAVAMLGGLKISGFPAWWLWRTYYLFRIPTLERKIRVAIDWTLDLFFTRDTAKISLPQHEKTG
jgi:NADH:ubiquinone reductase (H+-translocating)